MSQTSGCWGRLPIGEEIGRSDRGSLTLNRLESGLDILYQNREELEKIEDFKTERSIKVSYCQTEESCRLI